MAAAEGSWAAAQARAKAFREAAAKEQAREAAAAKIEKARAKEEAAKAEAQAKRDAMRSTTGAGGSRGEIYFPPHRATQFRNIEIKHHRPQERLAWAGYSSSNSASVSINGYPMPERTRTDDEHTGCRLKQQVCSERDELHTRQRRCPSLVHTKSRTGRRRFGCSLPVLHAHRSLCACVSQREEFALKTQSKLERGKEEARQAKEKAAAERKTRETERREEEERRAELDALGSACASTIELTACHALPTRASPRDEHVLRDASSAASRSILALSPRCTFTSAGQPEGYPRVHPYSTLPPRHRVRVHPYSTLPPRHRVRCVRYRRARQGAHHARPG